jgi:hypothetical protein
MDIFRSGRFVLLMAFLTLVFFFGHDGQMTGFFALVFVASFIAWLFRPVPTIPDDDPDNRENECARCADYDSDK